ncbi:hypothetical protein C5S36_10360 [Candidatus Methanophagaceae archaeon]|nr:hypothetical protein C5S36_10360 [Methanophagales archaeon]
MRRYGWISGDDGKANGALVGRNVDTRRGDFLTRCATPYISVERATVETSAKDDGMLEIGERGLKVDEKQ